MNIRLIFTGGILLAALAIGTGCNGGGSSAFITPKSATPGGTTNSVAMSKATVTITVPASGKTSDKRKPKYVSPSTSSIVVTVAGTPLPAVNLTSTSPGCTTTAGATTCTFQVPAPIGSAEPFSATSFDQQNGGGNQLSTGSTTASIVIDTANTVTLTLKGIVASVAFTLPKPVPACSPTTAAITVAALDADGNTISGTYSTPVTLTDSNATVSTISPTTFASSSTTSTTVTYTGGSSGVANIAALVGSTTVGTTSFVPTPTICEEYALTGTAVQGTASTGPGPRGIVGSGDYLYVADYSTAMISRVNSTLSAPTGTIVPIELTTITSTGTAAKPNEETIGPDGNLWVTDDANGIDMVSLASTTSFTTQNNYSQDGSGNQGSEEPEGIIVGPGPTAAAKLYYTNATANQIVSVTTAGTFTAPYSVAPTGTPATPIPSSVASPSASATPESTPIPNKKPVGIALGPDGNLWFAEEFNNAIGVMSPTGTLLHEYPVLTSDAEPYYITLGPDGAMWFTEFAGGNIGRITTSGTVTEYAIGNNSVPIQIVTALDGNLYFTDTGNNAIGRITPAGSISLYNVPTAKGDPFGLTVGPDGNIWFTESLGGNVGYLAY